MADLRTEMCGVKFKNPVCVSSNDFGETLHMAKRVVKQGIGGLVSKTVHKIDGVHRWPRPYFYSLRRFGKELRDTWICSEMFSHIPYEKWRDEIAPRIRDLCKENDVVFIPSISGIGTQAETWAELCVDMEKLGADIIELDTGGPHATFGAEAKHKEVGAPLALDPEKAYEVTKACVEAVKTPIMFKMTPQCVRMAEVALAIEKAGGHAISANNAFYGTWIDHETGTFYGGPFSCGALIGRAWQPFSLAKVLEITATVKIPCSGIGGIFTWDDVVRYIMAGCPTVQLCSVIYSRGVDVLREIIDGLNEFMDRKGYKTIKDMLGICVPRFMYLRDFPRENPMQHPSPIIPKFDLDKCNRCGTCAKLCPYGALTVDEDEGPQINDEYCMGCGWCLGNCPKQAVTMIKRDTGEVVWNGYGEIKRWVEESK
ncbi:MAG: Dihydroorotate dehydrogenase family protein [Thermoanaerobacterales bacterium 50_218]|nr:MAG: Dihydroorotate dehydrogenase family protein [Thermoanaerobacterales bacterium 50_218]HAA89644.1 hypothetical protein [Peptococcaceae bacterium]